MLLPMDGCAARQAVLQVGAPAPHRAAAASLPARSTLSKKLRVFNAAEGWRLLPRFCFCGGMSVVVSWGARVARRVRKAASGTEKRGNGAPEESRTSLSRKKTRFA